MSSAVELCGLHFVLDNNWCLKVVLWPMQDTVLWAKVQFCHPYQLA